MSKELPRKLPVSGPSIFSTMSALAHEHGAINLSQGFPGFPVDQTLLDCVSQAMDRGDVQYSPFAGHPRLVEQIQRLIRDTWGMERPASQINVTAGATQALFSSIMALIQHGDQVIVLDPAYDCYDPQIRLAGGTPVHVPLGEDLTLDMQAIKAACNDRTRMIVVNNPHNPGTRVFAPDRMDALMELAVERDLLILSDEVYEYISFAPYRSMMCQDHPDRVITVHSFGKSLHATGWKIGYLTAGPELMERIRLVHQNEVFCVNTSMQVGIADFLERRPDATTDLSEFYRGKRDAFLSALQGSNWKAMPCEGSYFAVLDYSDISDMPDRGFAEWLTKEHGVASIPLSVFYQDGQDRHHLRFCFAKQDDELRKATDILCKI